MADSVDRVFVHALNTVKKLPRSGSARPPTSDRLRLYGLYKQAMEGDVDGVMERPTGLSGLKGDELQRECSKWDAWNSQKGLSRTDAKRRYIEVLIEIMHKYAMTEDGQLLVAELEFVWGQIKHNVGTARIRGKQYHSQLEDVRSSLTLLEPMSEQDDVEPYGSRPSDELVANEDGSSAGAAHNSQRAPESGIGRPASWSKAIERALVALSAEVAALREQLTTRREWEIRSQKIAKSWVGSFLWLVATHIFVDMTILAFVFLWMMRRSDGRLNKLMTAVWRRLKALLASFSFRRKLRHD